MKNEQALSGKSSEEVQNAAMSELPNGAGRAEKGVGTSKAEAWWDQWTEKTLAEQLEALLDPNLARSFRHKGWNEISPITEHVLKTAIAEGPGIWRAIATNKALGADQARTLLEEAIGRREDADVTRILRSLVIKLTTKLQIKWSDPIIQKACEAIRQNKVSGELGPWVHELVQALVTLQDVPRETVGSFGYLGGNVITMLALFSTPGADRQVVVDVVEDLCNYRAARRIPKDVPDNVWWRLLALWGKDSDKPPVWLPWLRPEWIAAGISNPTVGWDVKKFFDWLDDNLFNEVVSSLLRRITEKQAESLLERGQIMRILTEMNALEWGRLNINTRKAFFICAIKEIRESAIRQSGRAKTIKK